MRRATALIAEDEPLLRDELKEALGTLWPELEVVGEAGDGAQALQLLHDKRPDIVFLDIEMPSATGLEVAAAASGLAHVVFVTAYGQHALAAFEHGAVDYLVKPLSTARLSATLARLRGRLREAPPALDEVLAALAAARQPRREHLRWISVGQGRTIQLITCDEVLYFQADNKYTTVVTAKSQALIGKTIRQLVDELDPQVFTQIHRGTIVNVHAIAAIERNLRGGLALRLRQRSETLAVSESFAHLFRHL